MSHHFAKPENALRKALDLVKVNKDDAALRSLHAMLMSRRYRAWQPAHEQIMMLYVQLAVNNRKNAKDGLLHYRNICQAKEVNSLEKIIKEFIRLAEAKASEAEAESVAVASPTPQATAPTFDLGYRTDVVHYFVPGVGGDDDQDRNKREIVTPWLKYLWDTYRTVLDVMRNNQHLDQLYHATVRKALQYCKQHQRASEFRRLCEIMRIHLNAIVNFQGQPNSVDISAPETVQAYLNTRFAQLECASSLDLWQEAYRIIEDIHELLLRSKIDINLDQSLLSNYYEKLELIFWKSSNPLFHAYCVDKLFEFSFVSSDAAQNQQQYADQLVIAALSIPVQTSSMTLRPAHIHAEDQKNLRLAAMLGFAQPPSRLRILDKIRQTNVTKFASDPVRQLFNLVSNQGPVSPIVFSRQVRPLLDAVVANEHLEQYCQALARTVTFTLLVQCSKVYRVLRMNRFLSLVPAQLSPHHVEQLVVISVKNGLVRARVDHSSDLLVFDADLASSSSRYIKQISTLAATLQTCIDKIHPISQTDKDLQRAQVFQLAKIGMDHEHRDVFIRKQVIEKRKQEAELAAQRREREEMIRAQQYKQRKLEDEQARLQEEKIRREKEREERLEKDRLIAQNLALIDKLKAATVAAGDAATLRSRKIIETLEGDAENVDREKLIEAQQEVQSQEQRAKERKLKEDFKRLDYTNRAMRLEERPLLVEQYNKQRVLDQAYYDEQWEKHCAAHRARHEEAVADKTRLLRMAKFRDLFYDQIMMKRRSAHKELVEEYNEKVREKEIERAEELKRQAELEAERERREEELERQRRAEEEARAAKARELDERRAQLDRVAEIQRKREQEIEERRQREAAAKVAPPTAAAAAATPGPEARSWRTAQPEAPRPAAAAMDANVRRSTTAAPERSWRRDEPPATAESASKQPAKAWKPSFRRDDANGSSDAGGAWRRGTDSGTAPALPLSGSRPAGSSWRDRAKDKN